MNAKNTQSLLGTQDIDQSRSRWSLLGSVLGPFLALGIVVAFFGIADSLQAEGGSFLTLRNLRMVSAQTATVAVAALGMTVIIIAGGIDLSAGTALALSATVLAWSLKEDVALLMVCGDNVAAATTRVDDTKAGLTRVDSEIATAESSDGHPATELRELREKRTLLQSDLANLTDNLERVEAASARFSQYSPALSVVLAIGTGCLTGFLNGVLIGYLRVVPFIVTLGTMRVYLGIAKEVASETTVRPDKGTQVPEWLVDFLSIRAKALWLGLPAGVWLTVLLAVILAAVLRYTVFGRHVFALGSNEATARLCGINVRWNKIAVYTLAGFFVGIGGLYQFSRLSVGNPTSGIGLELNIIAAVVIGGGSLSGGRGSVVGTLTGAAIMAVITSGCTQLGLRNPIQDIILGIIIVAAVAVDQVRQRQLAR